MQLMSVANRPEVGQSEDKFRSVSRKWADIKATVSDADIELRV
jgi:hypothetical protein